MNKTELVVLMAHKAGVTQKVAEDVLGALVGIVTDTLGNKCEKVVVTGLGTFEVRTRKARDGKNPRTGATIHVPAQKSPAFKAGKALKDAVKK